MNRSLFAVALVFALAAASPALANDWGTAADAKVCADLAKWSGPECQGEIAKRQKACLEDGDMAMDLGNVGYTPGTPNDAGKALCKKEATKEITKQLAQASGAKAQAAANEKAAAEALQKREMPKAAGHNPAIEKMVRANFTRLYPEKKLLKLIMDGKTDWEISRNGLGVITSRSAWATVISKKEDKCHIYGTYWVQSYDGKKFYGELEEHGAGAEVYEEILCSKVK